jgi:hypothetical protein
MVRGGMIPFLLPEQEVKSKMTVQSHVSSKYLMCFFNAAKIAKNELSLWNENKTAKDNKEIVPYVYMEFPQRKGGHISYVR